MANDSIKSPAFDFQWCLHCERAFPKNRPRKSHCPRPTCDGGIVDLWEWAEVRIYKGAERYPEIPESEVRYPLYNTKKIT